MKNKKNLLAREIINYIIFGLLTTLVNIISYLFFSELDLNYIICNIIAFILSIIVAFITNKIYVFKSYSWQKNIILKEIVAFTSTRIITFLIDMLLMISLVEIVVIGDVIAKCIVNIIVIVTNYIISKWVVFGKSK